MQKLILLVLLIAAEPAFGACRWVWIDHDHNSSTPAIRKQVCENTYDPPVIRPPSIRPIQTPSVKPVLPPTVPPIGTTRCRIVRVFEGGKWQSKRVCR
jgi:hypothetical protein